MNTNIMVSEKNDQKRKRRKISEKCINSNAKSKNKSNVTRKKYL